MNDSRRRFLRRAGGLVGAASLVGGAGCSQSPDPGTAGPAPTDSPSATPAPTDGAGTRRPTSTVATDVPALDGSWRSYRHDAANAAATDDPGPTAEPQEVWRRATATDAVPATTPVPADGAFVVVMGSGVPYALDADDGAIRWTGSTQASREVDPAAAGGTVAVANGQTVVGVATDTGDGRWSVSLDGPVVGLATGGGAVVVATEGSVTVLDAGDGAEQWHHTADGTVATRPAVGDGTVAVGLASDEVLAVDADSGDGRWREAVDGPVGLAPAVARDRVFVPTADRLLALDATDGRQRWSVETDYPVATTPVVADETVYLGTLTDDAEFDNDGEGTQTPPPTDVNRFAAGLVALSPADGVELRRFGASGKWNFTSGPPGMAIAATADRVFAKVSDGLLAYDAATGDGAWTANARGPGLAVTDGVVSTGSVGVAVSDGAVQWRFEVGDRVNSSPSVVGNTAYVGSDDYHLYALAANAGRVAWRARTDGRVRSSPAVGDDAVYVGSDDGSLHAFAREDGERWWRFEAGGPVRSSPTIGDGVVYVGGGDGRLYAVDTTGGTERWHVDFGERFLSATPAVADGTVYAGAGGVFRAMDAGDGTEQWSVEFGNRRLSQAVPAVADGRVFVTPAESLRAIDASDGSELWSRPTGGTIVNAPAVRDEVVYAPGDESVYAFDVETGDRLWQTGVGRAEWVVAGHEVVFADSVDDSVVALDPSDGSELWRHAGVDAARSPGVAGDYLFVGDFEGAVHALAPTMD